MKYFFLLFFFLMQLFSSELINVNFKDLHLKELIKITSENINKNILLTQDVKGTVDFISQEPISKEKLLSILKYSLDANGFDLIEEDEILRVVKKGLKSKFTKVDKKQKNIAKKNSVKKEILKKIKNYKEKNLTEVIFLTNIDAKSLEKILKSIITQRNYIDNTPSVSIDETLNSIILDGSHSEVNNLKKIIKKLDVLKEQVYVKAKIIELDNSLLEEVGLQYGILGGKVHSGGLYTFSSNLNGGNSFVFDISKLGIEIPNVTSSLALGASLNLLNRTYALNIISEPSILCINNMESSIYVGETVSIQTGSTTTDAGIIQTVYKREDIGLTLKVTPRVSKNNKILLKINTLLEGIKNENFTNFNPNTSKKEVKTTAILNNGESVIIGGLLERKNQKTIEKIPLASDIPLIGELFKNRLNDSQNTSLIVIVTPYLIPKNKDLTYVREQLSRLKVLEDEFLEKVLLNLRAKRNKLVKKDEKETNAIKRHNENMKKIFGTY